MNGFHVYMSQYSLLSLHEFCDARGSRPIKTADIFFKCPVDGGGVSLEQRW